MILEIDMRARDVLLKNAQELRAERETDADSFKVQWLQFEANGMFAILRAIYPSAAVGLLVMDYDEVLDGCPPEDTFTTRLPHLS